MKNIPSAKHATEAELMMRPFLMWERKPDDARPLSEYSIVDIGTERFFTLKISGVSNALMQGYSVTTLLGQLSEQQIQKVMVATSDEGLTPLELQAKALGPATLQAYLNGQFSAPDYYALMIRSLARLSP